MKMFIEIKDDFEPDYYHISYAYNIDANVVIEMFKYKVNGNVIFWKKDKIEMKSSELEYVINDYNRMNVDTQTCIGSEMKRVVKNVFSKLINDITTIIIEFYLSKMNGKEITSVDEIDVEDGAIEIVVVDDMLNPEFFQICDTKIDDDKIITKVCFYKIDGNHVYKLEKMYSDEISINLDKYSDDISPSWIRENEIYRDVAYTIKYISKEYVYKLKNVMTKYHERKLREMFEKRGMKEIISVEVIE